MDNFENRSKPNIIITGTPGVGKTVTTQLLAEKTNLKILSINTIIKEHHCHEGLDTEYNSLILDEDKLLQVLEQQLQIHSPEGCGNIIDYHACDFFPPEWIDLVIVLRASTEVLYDRLSLERNYTGKKLEENMECEIMQVLLEEAREVFDEEMIVELQSNSREDLENNIQRIEMWLKQWYNDNQE